MTRQTAGVVCLVWTLGPARGQADKSIGRRRAVRHVRIAIWRQLQHDNAMRYPRAWLLA